MAVSEYAGEQFRPPVADQCSGMGEALRRNARRKNPSFAFPSVENRLRLPWAVCLALFLNILTGCATKEEASTVPKQQNGIQEYQQITADAMAAMKRALQSLDLVSAQTNPCPTRIVDAFSDEIQRLQVDSIQVRAHAQAIQARGDAYFENWSENLARVKDPKVRELAERFHPQLQQSFYKIKTTSQETGDTFRNFFSGLRKLRNSLQSNPGIVATESTRDLIRTTRNDGEQVLQLLNSINAELRTMKAMLTPGKATSNP
jgi:hypothetical protein